MPKRKVWASTTLASGLLVLALAVAARMHRASVTMLGEEEFLVLNQPRDTGFVDYLVRMHSVSPDHLPFFYVITYFLRPIFDYHWLVPRGLSMVTGVAAIALAWRLTGRWFGARAGLFVGIFLALSPADVYYGATWRSYGIQIILAAMSLWFVAQALEGGRRRHWALTAMVNTFNVMIHPWGLLIVGAEGLWILGERTVATWRSSTFVAVLRDLFFLGLRWSLMHVIAVAIALGWWASGTSEGLKWYLAPRWDYFLTDVLGDAYLHGNLFTYDTIIARGYASYAEMAFRGPWDPLLSRIVDLATAICIAFSLLMAVRLAFRSENAAQVTRLRLLLLFAFFPALLLYVLAIAWFPVALPRYTAGSSLPLYALVAIGLASLRIRLLGNGLAVALALCLAWNCAMWARVIPDPDWPTAAEMARQRPNPTGEVVLLEFTPFEECDNLRRARSLLEYAYNTPPVPYRQAATVAGAVDACAAQVNSTGRPACLLTRSVWNIDRDRKQVAEALRAAGMLFRERVHKDFVVYTITAAKKSTPWAQPPTGRGAEYLEALRPFIPQGTPESEIHAAVRWAVEEADSMERLLGSSVVSMLMLEISPGMAMAAAQLQAQRDPESAAPALLLARRGLGDTTVDEVQTEQTENALGALVSRRLLRALGENNLAAGRTVLDELKQDSGMLVPQSILQILGLEARLPYAAPLGIVHP